MILMRQEDFPLEISVPKVPTRENLLVGAEVRVTVQADDAAMFLQNLLWRAAGTLHRRV